MGIYTGKGRDSEGEPAASLSAMASLMAHVVVVEVYRVAGAATGQMVGLGLGSHIVIATIQSFLSESTSRKKSDP